MIKDYVEYRGTRFEKKLGVELSIELWDSLKSNILDQTKQSIELADDWVNAVKEGQGWTKYGRLMYSKKINKLRQQTMSEFYGKSLVD